jgi:hypothetical protein
MTQAFAGSISYMTIAPPAGGIHLIGIGMETVCTLRTTVADSMTAFL